MLRSVVLVVAVLLAAPQPVPLTLVRDFRAAQEATLQQDYAAAADALDRAAARLPYSGYVVYRAGLADISAGRFEDAVRRISSAAELDGWTPARRIALGDAYLGLGDRDAALVQWELARGDLPEDDGLLARLANNYEAVGRYDEAVGALTALARVRGDDPALHYRLAVLTAATAPSEALARLAVVIDLSPDLTPSAEALRQAIEAGLASGDQAYTFGRVGFAYIQMKEWALAELALGRAVALNPEYADAHAYLGLAQDMQARDGLAAYESAVALAPGSPLAQYLLGLHWRRAGDSATALPYLTKAQELDRQNPALAAEIGGAYASLGDLPSAESWLTKAVSLDRQNPEFWLLLARFYADHNYHVAELGLPAARMAAGLSPDSAPAADVLGYALVLTGDMVNGQEMLERAVSLDPQLPSVYYHLGLLYARQGRMAEAETVFNHTLALDPEGIYGGLALKALALLAP